MAEDPTDIGSRVKRARLAKSYSQTDLAQLIGITQPSISAIEAGGSLLLETLRNIAVALEVHLEWLATGRGEINCPTNLVAKEDGAGYSTVDLQPQPDARSPAAAKVLRALITPLGDALALIVRTMADSSPPKVVSEHFTREFAALRARKPDQLRDQLLMRCLSALGPLGNGRSPPDDLRH